MSSLPIEQALADEGLAPVLEVLPVPVPGRAASRLHDRAWLLRRALAAADLATVVAAFLLTRALLPAGEPLGPVELAALAAALPLWIVLAKVCGLYDSDEVSAYHSTTDELPRIVNLITIGTWLVGLGGLALGSTPDLRRLAVFWACALPIAVAARTVARAQSRRRPQYVQNTVIVGAGDVGQLVAQKFLRHPECGIEVLGFVDSFPKEPRPDLLRLPVLGAPEDLPAIVERLDVERVVIAFSVESHEQILGLIRSLRDLDVQIDIIPRLFDLIGRGVHVHELEGIPMIGLAKLRLSRSSRVLKRALDLTVSTLALAALAPVLALVAVAIKLDSRGPVFFRQVRVGAGCRPFRLYKFRTMVVDADARKQEFAHLNRHARAGGDPRMFKILHDPRVTRTGRVLRRYFLDELPQLLNVLHGEMSLIGPRPLILEEDVHVESWGRRRLDLKPGMTGVWQVLGRSAISFDEMVRLDYLYVTTWSLANDLRLLARTVPLVLQGDAEV